MRKFTFLFIALLAIVGYANAAVDSSIAGKKVTAVGAATTTIDTEAWYLLYCQSRGCYVSEETSSFIMRGTGNFTTPVAASVKAGYMFQFVATENANEYYIKSGNGLYFKINQGGSVVSNEPVAYTIAQIGDNAGHFYGQLVEDGRVLDANADGGSLAGWNTTVPTGTGGNNDYQFLPLTLEAASYVNVTYNFTYEDKVIYTQQSLVEEGAAFPEYNVTLPYPVTIETEKPSGVVSAENATQEIALAVGELPFAVSTLESDGTFGEGMHWYTVTLKGADLTYNAASNVNNVGNVSAKSLANFYAFTGNPFDGFKMFNYVAGSSKVAWSATVDNSGTAIPFTDLADVTPGTDWVLNANNSGYGLRRLGDVANAYANNRNNNMSYWPNGGAATDDGSRFLFTEVTTAVLETIAADYKASTIATLDEWAKLSVVFDAELVASAKAAVEAVEANSVAAFAEIDSKLTDVTDAVAAKMFTFRNSDTNSQSRVDAYLAANMSDDEGYGTKTFDYNAIWSLRHAGGTAFYLYNELNGVYLGSPSSNGDLTTTPTASYTFEIVDAENNKAELKCNGETLHLNNHTDGLLSNYDENDAASRWYIATIDVAADIQEILDGLTEADYAEVPALGQYTTAAYNALVAARTSAKTVAEVEAAIAEFNKAKNVPVYFITSAWDGGYSAGSAILYNGSAWRWAAANKYNKQMWMTIPAYTQANVPIVNAYNAQGTSYEICDYLTGTVMRGKSVQIVAVDGWEGAYSLQYNADANSTDAAQHAQSGGALVNWKPALADNCQASAWRVEYLGASYDLDQLTDEKMAALSALKSAYDEKAGLASAKLGNALGQYSAGNIDAIVAAEAAAKNILNSALAAQATLEISAINAAANALNDAAATLVINMPAPGKYYRIQGACEASLPGYYITGHTNADGGRIALTDVADASTIYYFDGTNLIAYQSGLVVGLNATHWTFASIENNNNPASEIKFAQSPRTAGAYTVKSADRYFHYTVYNNTVQVNRCQDDVCKEHDWYLTEVTELPVTISAAEWASFYAPVAVTLPEGVKAYYAAEIEENKVEMTEIEGTIPANTGVMLNGGAASYNFVIAESATAIEGENMFKGTVATTQIAEENTTYYLLSMQNGVVGLYPHGGEGAGNFQNNSHKAYLPVTTTEAALSYGFTFGGTTAIEGVEAVAGEQAIYDLTGRKIEAITVPGLYIINGVKTIVE